MKRYIHSSAEDLDLPFDLQDLTIESVVFVSDAREYRPGDSFISASADVPRANYSSMTREQLLQLPKKERERIHDVDVLRKLRRDELTLQQQRDVTQANMHYKFKRSEKDVTAILGKIANDRAIFIFPTQKNQDFYESIAAKGGDVTRRDVANVVRMLTYSDYQNSTYSYLDWDWGAELMVFHFSGSYAFSSAEDPTQKIEASDFKIYIKLDVETVQRDCHVALSFHEPTFGS